MPKRMTYLADYHVKTTFSLMAGLLRTIASVATAWCMITALVCLAPGVQALDDARMQSTSTLLPSGKVLVAGGRDAMYAATDSCEVFDPATQTWAPTTAMNEARYGHTATLLSDGRVLVAGSGTTGKGAEIYDPALETWTSTGSMTYAHGSPIAFRLPSGKVLVLSYMGCDLYDPDTGTWTAAASMPSTRYSFNAVLLTSGEVLVAGGTDETGIPDETLLFDPEQDGGYWHTTGSFVSGGRTDPALCLLPYGGVLAAGGSSGTESEVYDPDSGTWHATEPMSSGHDTTGINPLILMSTGEVLMLGGTSDVATSCEIFNTSGLWGSWRSAPSLEQPRNAHQVTLLGNGDVLVVDGSGSVGYEVYRPYPLPMVTTSSVSDVNVHQATIAGEVLSEGGLGAEFHGFVWSTSSNPEIGTANQSVGDFSGVGTFTLTITDLRVGTTYHVRAYASNSLQVSYGEEVTFTTLEQAERVFDYTFDGTLTDVIGGSQAQPLAFPVGASQAGAFAQETLASDVTRQVFRFSGGDLGTAGGSGLSMDVSAFLSDEYAGSYSIGLVCRIDPPASGHGRMLDVSAGTRDPGLYLDSETGQMVLTGPADDAGGPVWSTGVYQQVVITRSQSGLVHIYIGRNRSAADITVMDANEDMRVTAAQQMRLFIDADASADTSPSGAIARLVLYVGVLTSDEVAALDLFPSGQTPTIPTVSVTEASAITGTSAMSGGNISTCNGLAITGRGVVWSTDSYNPEVGGANQTTDGADTGSFTSALTGLQAGTTYYVRAYATNSMGTAYSDTLTLTTGEGEELVADYEFDGSLVNGLSSVSSLTFPVGAQSAGTFAEENLSTQGEKRQVFQFSGGSLGTAGGSGLSIDVSDLLGPTYVGSYSLGLVCRVDVPSATYARLIDTSAGIRDAGVYLQPGSHQIGMFRPGEALGGPAWSTGVYQQVVITRTESGLVRVYVGRYNGTPDVVYQDDSQDLRVSSVQQIRLFVDSDASADTSPSGAIARLQVYRGVLSDADVGALDLFPFGEALAPPTVTTTTEVHGITATSAISGGFVATSGGKPITQRGVFWNWTPNSENGAVVLADGTGTGNFACPLTDLAPNTTYYYRAFASNQVGTGLGPERSFTTPSDVLMITGQPVDQTVFVGATTAFTVTATGAGSLAYQWSTSADAGATWVAISGATASTYATSSAATLSESGTKFRVSVSNDTESVTSTVATLTVIPLQIPAVTTAEVHDVAATTASGGGEVTAEGGATVTARGVVWSTTTEDPVIESSSHTSDGMGAGTFTSSLTGLQAVTTYHLKAYATNSEGTAYGLSKTFTTSKLPQTITFGSLAAKTYGDGTFALTATASSGLTVTYASSNTAIATVSGSTVTIQGAGTATITASQSGNATYDPATSVGQLLTVNKASQTITFGTLTAKTVGDAAFTLGATASSGLAVSYQSSDTSVATVSGSTVSVLAEGTTTITAAQAGNANYLAASSVQQSLQVNAVPKQDQTITFTLVTPVVFGDAPVQLAGTATSGLSVAYTSSNPSVATVSGSTLTIAGIGTATITASQAGNASFNPAPAVARSLTVASPPSPTAPSFAPPGGTYADTVEVALSATPITAAIHYTIDGSVPTSASPTYSSPISVDRSMRLSALAVNASGTAGSVAVQDYVTQVAMPTFDPSTATFSGSLSVTASTTTSGAAIHYTTDGTTATAASPLMPAPLVLTASTTLHALAVRTGCTSSAEATATYTKSTPQPPRIRPESGAYFGPLVMTMQPRPTDTKAWFTTVALGQQPIEPVPDQAPAELYTQPVTITASTIVRAIGVTDAPNQTASASTGAVYLILSPSAYTINGGQTISSFTSPATIEGQGSVSGVTMTATSTAQGERIGNSAVTALTDQWFYTEALLQPASADGTPAQTTVAFTITDKAGQSREITKSVTWQVVDLNAAAQQDLVIRAGDSLQFAATSSAATVVINPGMSTGTSGQVITASGAPVRATYDHPGYYSASAWANGALIGSRTIRVVGLDQSGLQTLVAQIDTQRDVTLTTQPKGVSDLIFAETNDASLMTVQVAGASYELQTTTVRITALQRGTPRLIIRVNGPGSPILAIKEVTEYAISLVQFNGKGSAILTRPYIPGLKLQGSQGGPTPTIQQTDPYAGEVIGGCAYKYLYGDNPASENARPATFAVSGTESVAVSESGTFASTSIIQVACSLSAPTTVGVNPYYTNYPDYPEETLLTLTKGPDADGDHLPEWTSLLTITQSIQPWDKFVASQMSFSRSRCVGDQPTAALRARITEIADNYGGDFGSTPYDVPSVTVPFYTSDEPDTQHTRYMTAIQPRLATYFGSLAFKPGRFLFTINLSVGGASENESHIWQGIDPDGDSGDGGSGGNTELLTTVDGGSWTYTYHPNDPTPNPAPEPSVAAGPNGYAEFTYTIGSGSGFISIPTTNGLSTEPIYSFYGTDVGSGTSFVLFPGSYWVGSFHVTVTSSQPVITWNGMPPTGMQPFSSTTAGTYLGLDAVAGIPHYWQTYDLTNLSGSVQCDFAVGYTGGEHPENDTITVTRDNPDVQVFLGGDSEPLFQGTELSATVTRGQLQWSTARLAFLRDDEVTLTLGLNGQPRSMKTFVSVSVAPGRALPAAASVPLLANLATNNLVTENTAISIPVIRKQTALGDLDLTLSYNSRDGFDVGYGPGWRTNFDMRILCKGQGDQWSDLILFDEDGARALGLAGGTPDQSGIETRTIFLSSGASLIVLIRTADELGENRQDDWQSGERYRMVRGDGRTYYFNNKGWLIRTSRNGHGSITVHRDVSDAFLYADFQETLAARVPEQGVSLHTLMPVGSTEGLPAGSKRPPLAEVDAPASGHWAFAYDDIKNCQIIKTITLSGSSTYGIPGFSLAGNPDTESSLSVDLTYHADEGLRLDSLDNQAGSETSTTTLDRDTQNHTRTIHSPLGGDLVFDVGYDLLGSFTTCTYPNGQVLHQETGGFANIIRRWIGSASDRYQEVAIGYEMFGRPSQITRTTGDGATTVLDSEWDYLRDTQGKAVSQTTFVKRSIARGVSGIEDASDLDLVTEYDYFTTPGLLGHPKSELNPDRSGRFTQWIGEGLVDSTIDPNGHTWTVASRDVNGFPYVLQTPEGKTPATLRDPATGMVAGGVDALGYQTRATLDKRGLANGVEYPGSHLSTEAAYDPLGKPTRLKDASGRTTTYLYDLYGRCRKIITTPNADTGIATTPIPDEVFTYVKTGSGNATQWTVTQTRGSEVVVKRVFDAVGHLLQETVPRTMVGGDVATTQCTTTYQYHAVSGFLTSVVDPDSHGTTFEYDRAGRLLSTTSATGLKHATTYNALGWVLTQTTGEGALALTTRFVYDRSGRVVRTINPAGGWTATTYDPTGAAMGDLASLGKGTALTRDQDGVVSGVRDAAGNKLLVAWTSSGAAGSTTATRTLTRDNETEPLAKTLFDIRAFPTSVESHVAGAVFATATGFRNDGSVQSITRPERTPLISAQDGLGRLVRTEATASPGGSPLVGTTTYGANGAAVTSTSIQGRTTQALPEDGTGEVNVVQDNGSSTSTALANAYRILERDRRGNVLQDGIFTTATTATDATPGLVTLQTYDADNRLTSRTTPDGVRTEWEYDGVGRVAFIRRGPAGTAAVVAHYTYDLLGDVTSVTDGSGRVKTSTYDTLGTLTSETVGNDTTTYVYHPDTRALAKVIHPDGGVTENVPDARGRLGTVINPRGFRTVYDYDDLDRVIHLHRPKPGETDPTVANAQPVTEDFTYVADTAQVKTHTDLAGRVTTNFYDGIGRLTRREIDDHGTVTSVFVDHDDQVTGGGNTETTYVGAAGAPNADGVIVRTYNRAGRLANLTLPGQSAISLTYDTAGRLTDRGGVAYAYKATGQLDTISGNGGLAKFYFDAVGRLDSVDLPHGLKRVYTYDPADRPETLTNYLGSSAAESWSHIYDEQGRIRHLTSTADGVLASSTEYAYRSGRLIGEERTGAAAVNATYGYDGNGNRTSAIRYDTPSAQSDDFSDPETPTLPTLGSGWTVANGTLNVDLPASGNSSEVTAATELALTASGEVHGPRISVSVNPALVAASGTPQGTVASGLRLTVDATTAYRVQWRRQLSADFEPVTLGRLVLDKVTTSGSTTTTELIVESEAVTETTVLPLTITVTTGADGVLNATASNATVGTVTLEAEVDLGPTYAAPPAVALVISATGTCRANTTYDQPSWTTSPTRTVGRDAYDGLDRLLSHQDLDAAGGVLAGITYGRDALGRMTNRVTSGGSVLATYGYDALDRMQSQSAGGVTTTFGYMGPEWMRRSATPSVGAAITWTFDDQGITSRTTSGQTTAYQRQGGGLLWESTGGATRSYALDSQGNVSGLVGTLSANGGMTTVDAFVSRFDYDAWGQVVRERFGLLNGSQPEYPSLTPFSSGPRYRGMWYDGGANGMYKTATRFYDPALGQFLQEDPARAGGNWTAYAGGDPVNRSDPSGLDWVWNADANRWDWDNTWDGKVGVGLAEVPWTVREPLSARGNPGDRVGITFYRQAGLLDIGARVDAAMAGYEAAIAAFENRQSITKGMAYSSGAAVIVGAPIVAPAIVPVALSGKAAAAVLTMEAAGAGFGAFDTALDPGASGAEVAQSSFFGAATGGTIGTVALAVPPLGQALLTTGLVGYGGYSTYDAVERGNVPQAFLRGTGTLLGASGLAGQYNPRLAFFNYEFYGVGFGSTGGNLRVRYVGPSNVAVGPYKDVGGHHLSQDAAFRDVIPKAEGLATPLRGNAFSEPGSPHYNIHAFMETFWSPFRFGGSNFGKVPTVGDYNSAAYTGLLRSGLLADDAQAVMAEVAAQQAAHGLSPNSPVPRIPGPIYQSPP